ncbi:hypothetical protein QFZ34_001218 [Phyllobacterium ifriqiyense]|uniref:Uncharacterized protein n=1 Tax=Phyllobacterium ifriqiyense TaxID=314238 RepID=A0ABU0S5X0_9HYPH|nr:hypothetical protein [Phyllobacterium ifriqiyense]
MSLVGAPCVSELKRRGQGIAGGRLEYREGPGTGSGSRKRESRSAAAMSPGLLDQSHLKPGISEPLCARAIPTIFVKEVSNRNLERLD